MFTEEFFIILTDDNDNLELFYKRVNTPMKSKIETLCNALNMLDPFVGEAFVGVNELDRKLFTIGTEVAFPGFLSGSTLWRVATDHVTEFSTKKKKGTIFIVKSKTGRYMGQYSQFSYDSEVIFRPFTKFKVTNWYHGDVVCLGQANIRKSTFTPKDDNLLKAVNCESCIIIELEELIK